ncbi:MAG: hypothetical protein CL815_00020 [Coraliomargarita sp.]|nr:hypothetical protein [Coraliomargarita sp.]|tara:strand:- start:1185 stop:1754 length:570 start_codon:yes stop_codon:yes gene_type:complete
MSLQSLTSASQANAESTSFAVEMNAGKISNDKYLKYLWNMYMLYDIMEDVALSMGCFAPMDPQMPGNDLPLDGLMQASDILEDFKELGGDESNPPATVAAIDEYINHIIKSIQHDKQKLMAHVYANHMGDLEGKYADKVPGSGKMYQFADMTTSKEEMKNLLDARVSDADSIECNIAYGYRQKIYEQLA